jgi:opacity protein-like surface antigen
MFKRSLLIGIMAAPLLVSSVQAQSWDTPEFYSPKPMDDLGLYFFHNNQPFFSAKNGTYEPNGLKLIWRQTGNINLGLQGGFGDLKDLGGAILLGAEAGRTLSSLSASGLAAAWSLGAGAVFGSHYVDLAIPLGVSIGLNLGSGFTPYVHPRVSFDLASVDNTFDRGSTTTTDVGLAVDLGVELNLGQTLLARAAYTAGNNNNSIGKRNAFGAGLALRMPRKVVVRGR